MISQNHFQLLGDRGLSEEHALQLGIYSARRVVTGGDLKILPDERDGNILVFPYIKNGEVVNEKFRAVRDGKKIMWQTEGGEKCFYNADVIRDNVLTTDGGPALVITEGELDCLAVISAGHHWCVSIPGGSLEGRDKRGNLIKVPQDANDIIPEEDTAFAFIFGDNWDLIEPVRKIVIATDNDPNGIRMRQELARRLGRERCYFIDWPWEMGEGPKDLNDVLKDHGSAEVIRLINGAKPFPIDGVYKASEIPAGPPIEPVSTGFPILDQNLKVFAPSFMVVTGRAGHGKSTWTTQLVTNLARQQGWKTAIASFEMVHDYVLQSISCIYHQSSPMQMTHRMKQESDQFIDDNFVFITPNPDSDAIHDVDWLLTKARQAVVRHGVKVLLIDPWNEIEHSHTKGESTTEYTNRAIMKIKRFARDYGVLVIVVAHPTKSGAMKDAEEMSLYDISDSAAFQNKADFGVVVARTGDPLDNQTTIYVTKVRYMPDTGEWGSVNMRFDRYCKMFVPFNTAVD